MLIVLTGVYFNGYTIINTNIFKARIKFLYLNRTRKSVIYVYYKSEKIMVYINSQIL